MMENKNGNGKTRRTFLKEAAAYTGGIALAGYATGLGAMPAFASPADVSTSQWAKQVGHRAFHST